MKKTRYFLYIFLIISSLFLINSMLQKFLFEEKDAGTELEAPLNVDMQLGAVHFTETEEGEKKWELTADDVQYSKGETMMRLKGVNISYLSKNNEPIIVRSKEGLFNSESGDIKAFGDVVVTTGDGETLYSDSLDYNAGKELITTDSEVTLESKEATIRGRGLLMDLKNDKFDVLNNVHVTFHGNSF